MRALPVAVLAALLAAGALPLLGEGAPQLAPAAQPLGVPLEGVLRQPALEPLQHAVPRSAGTVLHTQMLYPAYPLPAGWDFTRVSLDVPLGTGFVTAFSWHLYDAVTGEEPSNLQVHIHHGLWFNLPRYDQVDLTSNFVFGTGEERTAFDLDRASDAQPAGPRYGIFFDNLHDDLLVLMLHNKLTTARVVNIVLDVTFVYGDAASIKAASTCSNPPGLEGDGCVAGADVHNVEGHLWGAQFDVPRDPQGTGSYIFPPGERYREAWEGLPLPDGLQPGVLAGTTFVAPWNATYIAGAGHVHPGGEATIVVNLGREGSGCEADLDHDGLPGVTLFRSAKFDRDMASWPFSEDFQMGVTKPGWRAPVHQGDRLAQFGVYANRDHPSYQAMTFTESYFDRAAPPPAAQPGCSLGDYAPRLLDGGSAPAQTVMNRPWDTPLLPMCGVPGKPACDQPEAARPRGLDAGQVLIAGFAYLTGDHGLLSPLGDPPVVHRGQSLTFTNLDTASVIRHTVTSCAWPCNGDYTANYPLPDGTFDSNKLGNVDYIDFATVPPQTQWGTPTDLAPGLYSYFCRIHPTMRGAFEVVP